MTANGRKLALVVRVLHQPTLIYKLNLMHKTWITKSITTSANFLLWAGFYKIVLSALNSNIFLDRKLSPSFTVSNCSKIMSEYDTKYLYFKLIELSSCQKGKINKSCDQRSIQSFVKWNFNLWWLVVG